MKEWNEIHNWAILAVTVPLAVAAIFYVCALAEARAHESFDKCVQVTQKPLECGAAR